MWKGSVLTPGQCQCLWCDMASVPKKKAVYTLRLKSLSSSRCPTLCLMPFTTRLRPCPHTLAKLQQHKGTLRAPSDTSCQHWDCHGGCLRGAGGSGSAWPCWAAAAAGSCEDTPAHSCITEFISFLDGSRCDPLTGSAPPVTHLQLTELVQQSPQEQNLAYFKPNGSKSIALTS